MAMPKYALYIRATFIVLDVAFLRGTSLN